MAHYAKLGLDNVVLNVLYVNTIDCMTTTGIEDEEVGLQYLIKHHGHENWKKCSYSACQGKRLNLETNEFIEGSVGFRANYPGIGWYYNSEYDIFHAPKPLDLHNNPCNSWTLNTTTGFWEPPMPEPTQTPEQLQAGLFYRWDEALYQSDNTKGWRAVTYDDIAPS